MDLVSEPMSLKAAPVPLTLGPAARPAGAHEVLDGQILLRVPGLARALVNGSGTRIEAEPGADEDAVSWFASRHVQTARRLAAGKFTLWGAGVVVDGRGVALIGGEASGKSTIAASLALRGCPVLADQTLDIEFQGETAVARARGDRLELLPESARALGIEPDAGEPVRPELAKRTYRFPAATAAALRTIVVLARSPEGDIELERLTGGAAIEEVLKATCMPGIIEAAGLRAPHFMWLMQVCAAAKVVRLHSRFESDIPAAADAVLMEARS